MILERAVFQLCSSGSLGSEPEVWRSQGQDYDDDIDGLLICSRIPISPIHIQHIDRGNFAGKEKVDVRSSRD